MNSLIKELLESPPPYLIFGNPTQDPDSLSCCLAMQHLLSSCGAAIYTDKDSIHKSLEWMLDPLTRNKTSYRSPILSNEIDKFNTYIVVDQTIARCPQEVQDSLKKKVVVDHHHSVFPDEVKNAPEGTLHRIEVPSQNLVNFFEVAPACASILVKQDILHPHLWFGIWADTVGLSVNQSEAINSAHLFKDKMSFTNEDFDWYSQQIHKVLPIDGLNEFLTSNIYMVDGIVDDKPFSFVYAVVKPKLDKAIHSAILNFLRKFSDVTCLVNSEERLVSLRSRSFEHNVAEFALSRGGGGHIRAAGFTLDPPNPILPFRQESHLGVYYALLRHFRIDGAKVRELSFSG